jgi:hypothetical protein
MKPPSPLHPLNPSQPCCRFCGTGLHLELINLGFAPPSNAYLKASELREAEKHYPLRVLVCEECWLTQTEDFLGHEQLFSSEYAYFSSCSSSWVEHARRYVEEMAARLKLNEKSLVVEIAANDGYLLRATASSRRRAPPGPRGNAASPSWRNFSAGRPPSASGASTARLT